jgi:hypothetical protein
VTRSRTRIGIGPLSCRTLKTCHTGRRHDGCVSSRRDAGRYW